MYLKTICGSSNFSVDPDTINLSDGILTIKFTGGNAEKYIVVQAFKDGNLADGFTSCAAMVEVPQSSENSVKWMFQTGKMKIIKF